MMKIASLVAEFTKAAVLVTLSVWVSKTSIELAFHAPNIQNGIKNGAIGLTFAGLAAYGVYGIFKAYQQHKLNLG